MIREIVHQTSQRAQSPREQSRQAEWKPAVGKSQSDNHHVGHKQTDCQQQRPPLRKRSKEAKCKYHCQDRRDDHLLAPLRMQFLQRPLGGAVVEATGHE